MGDIEDRLDIGDDGAARAGRGDRQVRVGNGPPDRHRIRKRPGTGGWRPDVGRLDPDGDHVVEQLEFFSDRRVDRRNTLDAIPQRLVVHGDARREGHAVPIIDQRARHTGKITTRASNRA